MHQTLAVFKEFPHLDWYTASRSCQCYLLQLHIMHGTRIFSD